MPRRAVPVLVAAVVLTVPALSGCFGGGSALGTPGVASRPSVFGLSVANVMSSSAEVRFAVDGEPTEIEVLVGRSLSALEPADDPRAAGAGYAATLDGLVPNTSYVAVVEVAVDAETVRSEPIRFATVPGLGSAETRIRPGIRYQPPGCTLAFVVESRTNGSIYALTAGHCLEEDMTLRLDDGTPFADVVVFRASGDDWGLVKIRPAMVPHVSPKVTHWTGPIDVSAEGELDEGDTVCYYGHGTSGDDIDKHRCGNIDRYRTHDNRNDEVVWRLADSGAPDGEPVVVGYAYFGDSGSPVVDHRTGEAVGIAVRGEIAVGAGAPARTAATAVYDVLAILEDRGYDLELVTADWDPPPANPIPVGPLP